MTINVVRFRQILLALILILLGLNLILHLTFEAYNVVVGLMMLVDGILWFF